MQKMSDYVDGFGDYGITESGQDSEGFSEFMLQYVERQLALHGYRVKHTAKALSMIPANLSRRLSQLGITAHREFY